MFTAPNMMMTVGGGAPVAIVGTPTATDQQTITLPAHAVGQLIVLCVTVTATAGADITKPGAAGTVPAWVTGFDAFTSDGALGIFWFIATATNHTSGTWGSSNATNIVAMVVRNYHPTCPIGGFLTATGYLTGTNVPAPAIAPYDKSGMSMLMKCHEVVDLNASSWDAAPAGYTRQAAWATSNGRSLAVNTRDDTTSDASANEGPNNNNHWIAGTVEVISQDTNAVLFDSAHIGVVEQIAGSTSTSYNHTVANNGADVFVTTVTYASGINTTGVTCGGVAMTQVGSIANNGNSANGFTQLWRRSGVAAGARAIVATFSGTASAWAVSSTAYLNVRSVSAATTTSGAGGATAKTQSVTLATGEVAVQAFGAQAGLFFALTSNAGGYYNRANNSAGSSIVRCLMNDSPASVTFSTTPNQSVNWATISVVLS